MAADIKNIVLEKGSDYEAVAVAKNHHNGVKINP